MDAEWGLSRQWGEAVREGRDPAHHTLVVRPYIPVKDL